MVTRIRSVLFHESQAFVTLVECILLWLDNNLTLHALVPKTAGMATLERIRSWSLGNELDHGRFPLLELPAFLFRCEYESSFITGWGAIRNIANLETVIVVDRRDFELNLCSSLDVNWRIRVFVLLRRDLNDLCVLARGTNGLRQREKCTECQQCSRNDK